LRDGDDTYQWNTAGRLVSATVDGVTSRYAYLGDGARISMTVDGETTTYTLDLAAPLVQVLMANEAGGSTTYLYGVTRIGEYDGTWRYHLADHLGSVRSLVGADGSVIGTRAYQPYGKPLSSAGAVNSIYGFTGEQTDLTGLVYLRARMYSPHQNRFLVLDPWDGDDQRPLTLNPYLYALGNPLRYTDPSGLEPLQLAGVWVEFVSSDECGYPVEFSFFSVQVSPQKWQLGEIVQVASNLKTVFEKYINLGAFASTGDFMIKTDISKDNPLKLVRVPLSPFPWEWTTIGAVRQPQNDAYFFLERYFSLSTDGQIWNGYHELAHKWDTAQGHRYSTLLDQQRRLHGYNGSVDPLVLEPRLRLVNDKWFYVSRYAEANWDNPQEDWAETVATILNGGVLSYKELSSYSPEFSEMKQQWVRSELLEKPIPSSGSDKKR
jgi:RHS repeat-associated protein